MSINEARQILSSAPAEIFDYLQPTETVDHQPGRARVGAALSGGNRPLGEALEALNLAVYQQFAYVSGSTDNSTPLATVWEQKKGVCQDFTHIMLSVLRTAKIARALCLRLHRSRRPAERELPTTRSAAPGARWSARLRPTPGLKCSCRGWSGWPWTRRTSNGAASGTSRFRAGRDFRDATPLRGTFKGTGKQNMKVKVYVKRRVPPVAKEAVVGSY